MPTPATFAMPARIELAKVALPNPTLDDYPWRQPIKVLVDPTAKLLHSMWAEGYRVAAEGLLGSAFSVPNVAAAAWAAERAGELVTEIDGVTHDRVLSVLRGLLGDAFSNPEVTQADVRATILAAFDGMAKTRADLIARTEVALAAGKGSAAGWKDAGVEYVLISDGDDFDEACLEADGAVWTLDQYDGNILEHPNCGRSASPLSAEEAAAQGVDVAAVAPASSATETAKEPQAPVPGSDGWDERLSALKDDEQPELGDVVASWQQTTFGEIRASAAGRDEHYEYSKATDDKMAQVLMGAVENDSAPAQALWRGLAVDDSTATRFASLPLGEKVDLNLSSWTDQGADTAIDYAAENEGKNLVVLETKGTWGLQVSDYVADYSGEWITDGRFVVSAEPYRDEAGVLHVPLEQKNVFTSIRSMRGAH